MNMPFDELRERMSLYFTAAELVEFLGISEYDIFENYSDMIWDRKKEILEEMGVDLDDEE